MGKIPHGVMTFVERVSLLQVACAFDTFGQLSTERRARVEALCEEWFRTRDTGDRKAVLHCITAEVLAQLREDE